MNLMNKVFLDELDKFVVVFIDDILIYSKSAQEHISYMPNSASVNSGLKRWLFFVIF